MKKKEKERTVAECIKEAYDDAVKLFCKNDAKTLGILSEAAENNYDATSKLCEPYDDKITEWLDMAKKHDAKVEEVSKQRHSNEFHKQLQGVLTAAFVTLWVGLVIGLIFSIVYGFTGKSPYLFVFWAVYALYFFHREWMDASVMSFRYPKDNMTKKEDKLATKLHEQAGAYLAVSTIYKAFKCMVELPEAYDKVCKKQEIIIKYHELIREYGSDKLKEEVVKMRKETDKEEKHEDTCNN